MSKKLVIIVDMQKDFIDGVLGTKEAQEIVPLMSQFIKENKQDTIYITTLDTHGRNYLDTQEGKYLPVPHCIRGEEGWYLNDTISQALLAHPKALVYSAEKPTFGMKQKDWDNLIHQIFIDRGEISEIVLMGVCTDICVVSNALLLKSLYPEKRISVVENLCAGVTPDKHMDALNIMNSCQINIISYVPGVNHGE